MGSLQANDLKFDRLSSKAFARIRSILAMQGNCLHAPVTRSIKNVMLSANHDELNE